MNLLIVDDDALVVQGVMQVIEKDRLGIREIFYAYRIREAREILKREQVDLLLCDIEMPMGSGLELMEWIFQEELSLAMIVLTSHREFQYATRAMRAGSMDYLLKPASEEEVNSALERAVAVRKKQNLQDEAEKNWQKNQRGVKEQYFRQVITGNLSGGNDKLAQEAGAKGISLSGQELFLPVLLCVKKLPSSLTEEEFLRTLKEMVYACYEKVGDHLICCEASKRGIFAVVWGNIQNRKLEESNGELLGRFWSMYQGRICGYQGEACRLENLAEEAGVLAETDRNNVTCEGKVFGKGETIAGEAVRQPFDYPAFRSLVREDQEDKAAEMVREYLWRERFRGSIDGRQLKQLREDFQQIFYGLLSENGIPISKSGLMEKEQERKLYEQSLITMETFLEWCTWMIHSLTEKISSHRAESSAVGKAEVFIRQNLEHNIGCEDVARAVNMSADYVSRMFRKEHGMSLQKFITHERAEKAKNLLAVIDIPVSEIAQMTGYSNFSHFSSAFKKATGMAPMDYRRQCKESRKG